jgi:hypothetical protein
MKKDIYVDPRHEKYSFGLPFWRDNEKLWALDVPVEEMDISEFSYYYDNPFWEDEEGNIVITPNEVINNPEKYLFHWKKIQECDTQYPLDIMKNKSGRWGILDGLHRLVKLHLNGEVKVKVRKIPREIIHLVARDEQKNPA